MGTALAYIGMFLNLIIGAQTITGTAPQIAQGNRALQIQMAPSAASTPHAPCDYDPQTDEYRCPPGIQP